MSVSYPNFLDWRAGQDAFSGLAIYRTSGAKLKTPETAEQITIAQVPSPARYRRGAPQK